MPDTRITRDKLWELLGDCRTDEANRINQQIDQRRFVGLEGEAAVGKSMVLTRVLASRYVDVRSHPGVVDLDGAWGIGRTAWLFFHAAAEAIAGPVALSHLEALDEGLMPSSSRRAGFTIHNLFGSEIADAVLHGSTLKDDRSLLTRAVDIFEDIVDVVLVIDHLEAPSRSPRHPVDIEQLLWQLRSVHQRNASMRICLCGRREAAEDARRESAAFYSDGIWLTITPPTKDVWEYVARAAWPTLDPEALRGRVEQILKLTHAQPASTIAVFAQDVGLTPLDAEQRAAEEFNTAATASLEHARSLHRLGAHLFYEIAQGQRPYSAVPGGKTEVTRALSALRAAGLLTSLGRGSWRLTEPLIGPALLGPWYDALDKAERYSFDEDPDPVAR